MVDTDSPPASNASDRSWQPSILLSVIAATLGGVVGFLILYKLHPYFPRPELPEMPQYPSEELRALYRDAELKFHSQNGAFDCAILGGCLGLLLGLVTGRKKVLSAIAGTALGVVSGGGVGAGIGYRVATDINRSAEQSLLFSSLYHFAIWGTIGILVFAAIAVVHDLKQIGNAIISGILAGVFAALAYIVVSSIMFPTANLSIVSPESSTQRFVWIASGCLALGLCLGLGFRKPKSALPQAAPV